MFSCLIEAPTTSEIYTLSLHDALPISCGGTGKRREGRGQRGEDEMRSHADSGECSNRPCSLRLAPRPSTLDPLPRSEEHTSELQSRLQLVCRLLLEKKNFSLAFFTHTP